MKISLRSLFELLKEQISAGIWWPGESRFEIAVGAILTQNAAWSNVEIAIANLREAHLLEPHALANTHHEPLADLIRPSGCYRQKAGYLHELTAWWISNDEHAHAVETLVLRKELRTIRGVGSETADDLLLYVYDRPVFIYDAYAKRLLAAAGYGEYKTYEAAKRTLDPAVQRAQFDVEELAVFHGLIVDAGKLANRMGGWETAYPALVSHRFHNDVELR